MSCAMPDSCSSAGPGRHVFVSSWFMSVVSWLTPSRALEEGRDALAASDAHRLQPIAALAPLQFMQQRGHDADAGGADRVAERDAGAVDIQSLLQFVHRAA